MLQLPYTFRKPARRVTRVFVHCSASDNPAHDNVATMRRWHLARGWSDVGYHIFVRKDGTVENGRSLEKTPAAQAGNNTGTIAICLHGLDERLFTDAQKTTLIELCLQIHAAYDGAVTFHGHREVAAKACPVIDYKAILQLDARGRIDPVKLSGNPRAVLLQPYAGDLSVLEQPEAVPGGKAPLLTFGDRGPFIETLQMKLKALGYRPGNIDGKFGGMTRGAVLRFQADNDLVEDGKVGGMTWEALGKARPVEIAPERARKTLVGLAADGSRIAQASLGQGAVGTMLGLGGIAGALEQSTGVVSQLSRSAGVYSTVLKALGPWIGGAIAVAGIIVVLQAVRAGRARVSDHRTGKTT
ncbi:MAG: peptidoglycan-binding domain-containing protein [Hyphomicrobiales bacterium]|nr:peptidoglycan-binding domain-containing protein [Hyphomicrobiales bacterium]